MSFYWNQRQKRNNRAVSSQLRWKSWYIFPSYFNFHFSFWSLHHTFLFTSNFFFCLFGTAPAAYGSSQARDWIRAAAVTYTTAVAMWDHHCARPGTETVLPQRQCWTLNPVHHSRNFLSCYFLIPQIFTIWLLVSTPIRQVGGGKREP